VRTSRLVRTGGAVYHRETGVALRRPPVHLTSRSPIVFSLLGVLGITLVLFVVVVMTAGLILGK
jgi:hypothetical protein